MGKIQHFKEMPLWNQARDLVKEVYEATSNGPFSRDWALRDQIHRSVISIPSNIAEGFERGGTAEFIQFLSYAKGSTGEVLTQLFLAKDLGYISENEFSKLLGKVEKTGRMIGGFINYLKKCDMKGLKYK